MSQTDLKEIASYKDTFHELPKILHKIFNIPDDILELLSNCKNMVTLYDELPSRSDKQPIYNSIKELKDYIIDLLQKPNVINSIHDAIDVLNSDIEELETQVRTNKYDDISFMKLSQMKITKHNVEWILDINMREMTIGLKNVNKSGLGTEADKRATAMPDANETLNKNRMIVKRAIQQAIHAGGGGKKKRRSTKRRKHTKRRRPTKKRKHTKKRRAGKSSRTR